MSTDPPGGTGPSSQAGTSLRERADRFADLACLGYFGTDHVSRREQAARLLAESPELTAVSCHAAAAAFDLEALREHLARDGAAAGAAGGPRDWPPLLYVCYSRIPEAPPHRDAVTAAKVLLTAGADGNTCVVSRELGGWRWSGLTGAMGEGEDGLLQQPPHARARELAGILLDAGADPNDSQGLYNTMFTPDNQWLELLLSHGLEASDVVDPDGDPPIRTLDYQLSQAVKMGNVERVSLLLEHGADIDATDIYNGRSNYENALLHGYPEIAEMLAGHGAEVRELSLEDRFTAAVMSGDESGARELLEAEPHLIENPALLLEAVNNPAATRLLLELGADPNTPKENGRVPLHEAAWSDNAEVVQLLLAGGARCRDPRARPQCHAGGLRQPRRQLRAARSASRTQPGRLRPGGLRPGRPAGRPPGFGSGPGQGPRRRRPHTGPRRPGQARGRTDARPAARPWSRHQGCRQRRRHAPVLGSRARGRGVRGPSQGSRRPGMRYHLFQAARPTAAPRGESRWPNAM